jgi:hypothetical protein
MRVLVTYKLDQEVKEFHFLPRIGETVVKNNVEYIVKDVIHGDEVEIIIWDKE